MKEQQEEKEDDTLVKHEWKNPELIEIADIDQTGGGADSPPENTAGGGLWS